MQSAKDIGSPFGASARRNRNPKRGRKGAIPSDDERLREPLRGYRRRQMNEIVTIPD